MSERTNAGFLALASLVCSRHYSAGNRLQHKKNTYSESSAMSVDSIYVNEVVTLLDVKAQITEWSVFRSFSQV